MYNLAQTGHLSMRKGFGNPNKYFTKRLDAINEILHLQPANFTVEKIHELRIAIKKIKALFSLISYTDSSFRKSKYYKPFKALFKSAGDLRSIQVEKNLLKKYINNDSDSYFVQLNKLMVEKSNELEKLIRSEDIARSIHKKKIACFLDAISEKDVKKFLKKDAKELVGFLEGKIFSEQNLHLVRKKLKTFYFIAKTTYMDIVIPEPWNRLQELLGEWHDEVIAIEHLRKAIYTTSLNQDEIARWDKVKHDLIESKENLISEIISTYLLITAKENGKPKRGKNVKSITNARKPIHAVSLPEK